MALSTRRLLYFSCARWERFCKVVHLAKSTPPSLIAEGFRYFDNDVHHCFALCTGVDSSNSAWEQPQLSLSLTLVSMNIRAILSSWMIISFSQC